MLNDKIIKKINEKTVDNNQMKEFIYYVLKYESQNKNFKTPFKKYIENTIKINEIRK